MSKGVPGTCHYCDRIAKQNIVWLKDRDGKLDKQAFPHCGKCDAIGFVESMWPFATKFREGVDYVIEPFEKPATGARGDGTWVYLNLRECPEVTISPGPPGYTIVRLPKMIARAFADQVREASHVAEPGCNDSDAHWHGHCGCK